MEGCLGVVRSALIWLIGGSMALAVVLGFWFAGRPAEPQSAVAPVAASVSADSDARSSAETQRKAEMERQEKDERWAIHMESKVRELLKDPDSAKFRNTRTFHGGGVPVACGEVNSKNSFGGMGGYQRFVAAGDIVALDEQVEGGLQELWGQFCHD